MRKGLLVAVAVVLVANAWALALVARNRSGSPDATLQLTERELRLPPAGTEETGVVLWLEWQRPRDAGARAAEYAWFDRAKLASLGFDCHVPPDSADAAAYYRSARLLAREVYAVFEYRPDEVRAAPDVPAVSRDGVASPPLDAADLARLPRLVPVDAGTDPSALRARYPDRARFLVAPAIARAVYLDARATGGQPRLTGQFGAVLPEQIFVPREHAALLARLQAGAAPDEQPWMRLTHDPRYRVTLRYGRNLEPWVTAVEPMEPAIASPPTR
jgi:hypothetical protein